MRVERPDYINLHYLHDDEVDYYLSKVHHDAAALLYGGHVPIASLSNARASEICVLGQLYWFVTFIDDEGDTSHHVFLNEEFFRDSLLAEFEDYSTASSWRVH